MCSRRNRSAPLRTSQTSTAVLQNRSEPVQNQPGPTRTSALHFSHKHMHTFCYLKIWFLGLNSVITPAVAFLFCLPSPGLQAMTTSPPKETSMPGGAVEGAPEDQKSMEYFEGTQLPCSPASDVTLPQAPRAPMTLMTP